MNIKVSVGVTVSAVWFVFESERDVILSYYCFFSVILERNHRKMWMLTVCNNWASSGEFCCGPMKNLFAAAELVIDDC